VLCHAAALSNESERRRVGLRRSHVVGTICRWDLALYSADRLQGVLAGGEDNKNTGGKRRPPTHQRRGAGGGEVAAFAALETGGSHGGLRYHPRPNPKRAIPVSPSASGATAELAFVALSA
jgi:hypothetical protein